MTTPASRTASHIAAGDTTFKDDDRMWRAVTGERETVAALVLGYGTWLWARRFSTYGLEAAARVFLLSGVVLVVVQLTADRSAT